MELVSFEPLVADLADALRAAGLRLIQSLWAGVDRLLDDQTLPMQVALGALKRAPVQRAVAVTGIAGPGGAVPGKPVGTVWLALAVADASRGPQLSAQRLQLAGDRAAVRHATVVAALQALLRSI